MQPIVHRLEDEYGDQIAFEYLNARTDGEAAFRSLNLPGHPVTLIFADGKEVYRGFGVVPEDDLREAIMGYIAATQ